jgi:cysteinyl-tRNA synthetase
MDDDLGTPAAVGAIFDVVREGNKAIAAGHTDAIRGSASSVRGMLAVLGCDPLDPRWSHGGAQDAKLAAVVDSLVSAMLAQRTAAREARDFAAADAIRDQLKAAGVEIEDTPQGPQWSV